VEPSLFTPASKSYIEDSSTQIGLEADAATKLLDMYVSYTTFRVVIHMVYLYRTGADKWLERPHENFAL
jgi:hypothetical protein